MKENIYTIPLMDAFKADDECPFCFLERMLEQQSIAFILGSAYMEDDVRMETDEAGFCRHHYKMMYDYGNRQGNALILSTHFHKLNEELKAQIEKFKPKKTLLGQKFKKELPAVPQTTIGEWAEQKIDSCYVCNHLKASYPRYMDTFFDLYKKNPEFEALLKGSKGFCLLHFKDVAEAAQTKLSKARQEAFYNLIFQLMQDNFKRLEEEILWFTDKFDYRNKDKEWGNAKDSIQRCMQKAAGGYPADPPFEAE